MLLKRKEKDLIFCYNTIPFQLQLNCLKKHYIYFKGELKKEYKKIRLSIELFYFFCYLCVTNNLFLQRCAEALACLCERFVMRLNL